MKSLFLVASLLVSNASFGDMQSMLDNFKSHNTKVMDLKKNPTKYSIAPRGFFEIKQAALNLEIAAISFNCNAKNRKLCSNQIAKNEVK